MTPAPAVAAPAPTPPAKAPGLTSAEARQQLASAGANTLPDNTVHAWRIALDQLWAPVPWMLEGTIVLELVLGKRAEAAIIAVLLAFNAGLGTFQQGRAQATLVRSAHAEDAQQTAVIRVVSNLALFNGSVIVVLVLYAWHVGMTLPDIVSRGASGA